MHKWQLQSEHTSSLPLLPAPGLPHLNLPTASWEAWILHYCLCTVQGHTPDTASWFDSSISFSLIPWHQIHCLIKIFFLYHLFLYQLLENSEVFQLTLGNLSFLSESWYHQHLYFLFTWGDTISHPFSTSQFCLFPSSVLQALLSNF